MNEKNNMYNILAIESSCDDTSVSILSESGVLSLVTQTQIDHAQYGGVVPELASRTHIEDIVKVVDLALKKASLQKDEITAIAVTRGPGLLGSIIVGLSFAKGMAQSLNIPLIEVHHMHAHILSHFIEEPKPEFPYLCLTVSGGHTQIVIVRDFDDMEIIGKTRDDAAGEAFDKSGKMLGLPYPSGPIIDKLSKEGKPIYTFPIASLDNYDFSFSGLKTAIRNFLITNKKTNPDFIQNNLHDICASIQFTIVETLTQRLQQVSKEYGLERIAIAGGVAANSGLRKKLTQLSQSEGWELFIPALKHCTDNAAMIAQAAAFKLKHQRFATLDISPEARMKF